SGHGLVHIGLRSECDFVHRLLGRGIDDGPRLLRRGLDPGAVDVELHTIDHDVTFLSGAFENWSLAVDGAADKKDGGFAARTEIGARSIGMLVEAFELDGIRYNATGITATGRQSRPVT